MKTKNIIVALALLALPAVVQAQFNYTTNNGAITITGYTGPGGDVTIPDTINGLPVTSIGDGAFSSCTRLTSVTIPNSVTSIGSYAFVGCTSLAAITVETNNPAYSSEIRVRTGSLPPMEMSERKIIARRAAFELKPNSVVKKSSTCK